MSNSARNIHTGGIFLWSNLAVAWFFMAKETSLSMGVQSPLHGFIELLLIIDSFAVGTFGYGV